MSGGDDDQFGDLEIDGDGTESSAFSDFSGAEVPQEDAVNTVLV